MKKAYPIILTSAAEGGYIVTVPDFGCSTQGEDIADAMYMARDVICLMSIDMMEDGKEVPEASDFDKFTADPGEIKLMVDVDFTQYRREHDTRAVRKNCTIPSWLNDEATAAGINFSAALQEALKAQLGIS